jgi:hypothetical protein
VTPAAVLVARRPLVAAVGALDVVEPGAKKKAAVTQGRFFQQGC